MKLRRLAPLATAVALAGTVLPAAAARPHPTRPDVKAAAPKRAVIRPSAHSVDVLSLRVDRFEH